VVARNSGIDANRSVMRIIRLSRASRRSVLPRGVERPDAALRVTQHGQRRCRLATASASSD
jgi:hypothetical protein